MYLLGVVSCVDALAINLNEINELPVGVAVYCGCGMESASVMAPQHDNLASHIIVAVSYIHLWR